MSGRTVMETPPMGPVSSSPALKDPNIASKCKTQPPVGKEWLFTKGPLPCRPRQRHGHVPERRDREDPATERRRWNRKVRYALCHLPARLQCTTSRIGRKIRVGNPPEAVVAGARVEQKEPELESRLQSDASKSRAQARPPHETKTRGKARKSARETTGCSRLQSSRCRSQPCTPRQSSRFVRSKAEDG